MAGDGGGVGGNEFSGLGNCGYCGQLFIFGPKHKFNLIKCPKCLESTALGEEGLMYIRSRGTRFICVGIALVILAAVITAATFALAKPGGHYLIYIGGFVGGFLYVGRGISLRSTKMSAIKCMTSPAAITPGPGSNQSPSVPLYGPGIVLNASKSAPGHMHMKNKNSQDGPIEDPMTTDDRAYLV